MQIAAISTIATAYSTIVAPRRPERAVAATPGPPNEDATRSDRRSPNSASRDLPRSGLRRQGAVYGAERVVGLQSNRAHDDD